MGRRNRRRSIVSAGFGLLVLGVSSPAWAKTVVTLWAASLTPGFDQWITTVFPKRVEEAYPDIQLEVSVLGSRQNLEEKRTVATAAGRGPDIFHESAGFDLQIAHNGAAMPLDRFIAAWSGMRDMIAVPGWRYRGSVYGVPYAISVTGYAYWVDILEEAGVAPPSTWEELARAGRKLTMASSEAGKLTRAGLGMWNDPTYEGLYPLHVFVQQLGASLYSADYRKPLFNTDVGRKALQYAKELYEVAYPAGAKSTAGFEAKGAAMHFWYGSQHSASLVRTYGPADLGKVRIARIPGPTGGDDSIAIANSWGWAINSQSRNPELAWKVIQLFLEPGLQQEFLAAYGAGGILSPRRSVRYPEGAPFLQDFMRMAVPPLTSWGPTHPFFGDVVRVASPLIHDALTGKRGTVDALAEADRLLTALFTEKGL